MALKSSQLVNLKIFFQQVKKENPGCYDIKPVNLIKRQEETQTTIENELLKRRN